MLLTTMIGYVQKMFTEFEKPTTYGSELERYIVANDPQTAYDVDRLTREFDLKNQGGFYAS